MTLAVERVEGVKPKFFGIENPTPAQIARAIKTFPVLPNHWDAHLSYDHFLFSRSDRGQYIAALESAGVIPFVCATFAFDKNKDNFNQVAIARENPFFLDFERGQEFLRTQLRLMIRDGAKPDHIRMIGEGQRAFEGMQDEILERFEKGGYKVSEAVLYLGESDSSVRVSMAPHFMGIYGPNGVLRWEADPAEPNKVLLENGLRSLKQLLQLHP